MLAFLSNQVGLGVYTLLFLIDTCTNTFSSTDFNAIITSVSEQRE